MAPFLIYNLGMLTHRSSALHLSSFVLLLAVSFSLLSPHAAPFIKGPHTKTFYSCDVLSVSVLSCHWSSHLVQDARFTVWTKMTRVIKLGFTLLALSSGTYRMERLHCNIGRIMGLHLWLLSTLSSIFTFLCLFFLFSYTHLSVYLPIISGETSVILNSVHKH